jgi:hypothetical protein
LVIVRAGRREERGELTHLEVIGDKKSPWVQNRKHKSRKRAEYKMTDENLPSFLVFRGQQGSMWTLMCWKMGSEDP